MSSPIISPRLWHWAERENLLLMAALASAFLLSLLSPCYDLVRLWLLHQSCHRSGRDCREAKAPLYRLRNALARLWQQDPPNFALLGQRHLPGVRYLAAEAHADMRSTPFSAGKQKVTLSALLAVGHERTGEAVSVSQAQDGTADAWHLHLR